MVNYPQIEPDLLTVEWDDEVQVIQVEWDGFAVHIRDEAVAETFWDNYFAQREAPNMDITNNTGTQSSRVAYSSEHSELQAHKCKRR